jgi:hypothetical protein
MMAVAADVCAATALSQYQLCLSHIGRCSCAKVRFVVSGLSRVGLYWQILGGYSFCRQRYPPSALLADIWAARFVVGSLGRCPGCILQMSVRQQLLSQRHQLCLAIGRCLGCSSFVGCLGGCLGYVWQTFGRQQLYL